MSGEKNDCDSCEVEVYDKITEEIKETKIIEGTTNALLKFNEYFNKKYGVDNFGMKFKWKYEDIQ